MGVLNGKKKLLLIGCFGGFSFPYYSKEKRLTKEHIYKEFLNDENLMAYLPDNADIRCISREFLLSVLFFGNRQKYLKLYEDYKDIQLQKTTTGSKKFYANITQEMFNHLRNFKPINM